MLELELVEAVSSASMDERELSERLSEFLEIALAEEVELRLILEGF
jgi:hypothetical protein